MGCNKSVLRVTFIAYIKKREGSQINNLTLHFKTLEKNNKKKWSQSQQMKEIKIRAEINKIENKKTIEKKSMKLRAGFWKNKTDL